MIDSFLHLTDRYGAPFSIQRDHIRIFHGDCCIQGNGEKQMTLMGTTLVDMTGGSIFVMETYDEVRQMMEAPE